MGKGTSYRMIDSLGRIVIPKHIRQELGLQDGHTLEFSVDEYGSICMRAPHPPTCKHCGKQPFSQALPTHD